LAGTARDAAERRRWWRDVATVVAIAGLLLTLLFNTIGVWRQLEQAQQDAEQARLEAVRAAEARTYTQIGVLTQLSTEARASQRAVDSSDLVALHCRRDYRRSDISRREEVALRQALGVYDFMSWLSNAGHMPSDDALAAWEPRMIEAARMGRRLLSPAELSSGFPQLAVFYRRADKDRFPLACPQLPPGAGTAGR
jgi:hypothetical protein